MSWVLCKQDRVVPWPDPGCEGKGGVGMHRRHALTLTLSLLVCECDAQKLSSPFFPARQVGNLKLLQSLFFFFNSPHFLYLQIHFTIHTDAFQLESGYINYIYKSHSKFLLLLKGSNSFV